MEENEKKINHPWSITNRPTVFGIILKLFLFIVVVGGLAFLGIKGYNYIKESDIFSALPNVENPFSTIHPDQFNTYDSIVKENEDNEDLGVEIIDFEPLSSYFFVGDQIQLRGVVKSSSLSEEDSNAVVKCELEDYYGETIIDPEEINIPGEGRLETTDILCSFESGLDESSNSKKATLNINYGFYSMATYDVYIMEKSEYDYLVYEKEVDPFEEYGFRPENIKLNNVMQSVTFSGPVNLAVSTVTSQPFYDEQEILFIISLKEEWAGDLWQLKDLKLKVPEEMGLPEDTTFCDFVDSEETEGNYKIYTLKQEKLDEVNGACSPEMLENIGMSEQRCIDELKTEIQFLCKFAILDLPEDQNLLHTNIVAETNYIYEIEKTASVKIIGSQVA